MEEKTFLLQPNGYYTAEHPYDFSTVAIINGEKCHVKIFIAGQKKPYITTQQLKKHGAEKVDPNISRNQYTKSS